MSTLGASPTAAAATRATTPTSPSSPTRRRLRLAREHLTAEVVAAYFAPLGPSAVRRLTKRRTCWRSNFVLYDVLAGGRAVAAHRHAGQDAGAGAVADADRSARRTSRGCAYFRDNPMSDELVLYEHRAPAA